MSLHKLILATTLAASAVVGLPSAAYAGHGKHWRHHHHEGHHGHRHGRWRERDHYERHSEPRRYYSEERGDRCRRSNGTTGLILGAAAGALLGRAVDTHGDRTPGTIIGAGGGALLGREMDRGC